MVAGIAALIRVATTIQQVNNMKFYLALTLMTVFAFSAMHLPVRATIDSGDSRSDGPTGTDKGDASIEN